MFTSLPNEMGSLYEEQRYVYSSPLVGDLTVNICESASQSLIGVKKFYNSQTVAINIAPMIRPFAVPRLGVKEQMGFVENAAHGALRVELVCMESGEVSDARTFTLSRRCEKERGLLSTIEAQRLISEGESDEICFVVEPQIDVQMSVEALSSSGSVLSTQNFSRTGDDMGMVRFRFICAEDDEVSTYRLTFSQGVQDFVIIYTVVQNKMGAMRLAWISSRGTVEHYTFVHLKNEGMAQSAVRELVLTSAFELYWVRSALSEIIYSPKVWLDCGDEYREVLVLQDRIDTKVEDVLAVVELKISCDA